MKRLAGANVDTGSSKNVPSKSQQVPARQDKKKKGAVAHLLKSRTIIQRAEDKVTRAQKTAV